MNNKQWAKLKSLNKDFESYDLLNDEYLFGKSKYCKFVINNAHISKHHFKLEYKKDDDKDLFLITDYSRNGISINKKIIKKEEEYPLKDGDIIDLCPAFNEEGEFLGI